MITDPEGTVLALLFFGGEVLNDFAFAMTMGVISGTYSTVYVATAFVMLWEERWPRRGKGSPPSKGVAAPPAEPRRKRKRETANV